MQINMFYKKIYKKTFIYELCRLICLRNIVSIGNINFIVQLLVNVDINIWIKSHTLSTIY
jgi:hypothetical protein